MTGRTGRIGTDNLDSLEDTWLAGALASHDQAMRCRRVGDAESPPVVDHLSLAWRPVHPAIPLSRRHAQRVRPSAEAWSDTMATLMLEHARHGQLCWHVVEREAAALGVAPTTLERRYGEHLRLAKDAGSSVSLSEREREVLRHAPSLRAAHAALERTGRELPFAHFERAVWDEQGDRDLVALRRAECARRSANRSRAGCVVCRRDDGEEVP